MAWRVFNFFAAVSFFFSLVLLGMWARSYFVRVSVEYDGGVRVDTISMSCGTIRYDRRSWATMSPTTYGLRSESSSATDLVQNAYPTDLLFPLWQLVLLTSILPLLRFFQRLPDADPNRCAQCGYNLRATPDRCPECGKVPERLAVR